MAYWKRITASLVVVAALPPNNRVQWTRLRLFARSAVFRSLLVLVALIVIDSACH
jgi:hypothetical protein